VVLIKSAQVIALFLGSFPARFRNDRHNPLKGEKASIIGAERVVVKANVVDHAGEVSFIVPRPDSQRLVIGDGIREFVLFDFKVARPPADE